MFGEMGENGFGYYRKKYQKILEKREMSFYSSENKNWTFRGSFDIFYGIFSFFWDFLIFIWELTSVYKWKNVFIFLFFLFYNENRVIT
jgi:hypothetical protein